MCKGRCIRSLKTGFCEFVMGEVLFELLLQTFRSVPEWFVRWAGKINIQAAKDESALSPRRMT